MPRKKSVKRSADKFIGEVVEIEEFLAKNTPWQTKENLSWLYNYAIIRLYKQFERLMLDALVGAINNDTATLFQTTAVSFPRHLTDEVCEFLITGTGFFDFKGRDGLIRTLKSFVPSSHYLVTAVKRAEHKESIEQLVALRNYAAHESSSAKRAARKAVGCARLSSSGAWLKRKGRFSKIVTGLSTLAVQIRADAPY